MQILSRQRSEASVPPRVWLSPDREPDTRRQIDAQLCTFPSGTRSPSIDLETSHFFYFAALLLS